jgi:hypothetical protein
MFLIFIVAACNLALGFVIAAYLGGHYRTIRKFGLAFPFPCKTGDEPHDSPLVR